MSEQGTPLERALAHVQDRHEQTQMATLQFMAEDGCEGCRHPCRHDAARFALSRLSTLQGERDALATEKAAMVVAWQRAIGQRDALKAENERLQQLAADLALIDVDAARALRENERLRAALRKLLDEDDIRAAREALGEGMR